MNGRHPQSERTSCASGKNTAPWRPYHSPDKKPWVLTRLCRLVEFAAFSTCSRLPVPSTWTGSFLGIPDCLASISLVVSTSPRLTSGGGTVGVQSRLSRLWRLFVVLALSFAALIAPYVIRLYLSPSHVGYHIAYVLWGRVFYVPFIIVALAWGSIAGWIHQKGAVFVAPLIVLGLAGYGHALLVLYDKSDFTGFAVLTGGAQSFPASWTPYVGYVPTWPVAAVIVTAAAFAFRCTVNRCSA